ncbi:hypothetical protein ACLOJK_022260 [Asimina triloba]
MALSRPLISLALFSHALAPFSLTCAALHPPALAPFSLTCAALHPPALAPFSLTCAALHPPALAPLACVILHSGPSPSPPCRRDRRKLPAIARCCSLPSRSSLPTRSGFSLPTQVPCRRDCSKLPAVGRCCSLPSRSSLPTRSGFPADASPLPSRSSQAPCRRDRLYRQDCPCRRDRDFS